MKKVLKIFMIFLIGDVFGCFSMYYFCKYLLSEHLTGDGMYTVSPDQKKEIDVMRYDPTFLREKDGQFTKIFTQNSEHGYKDEIIFSYFSQRGSYTPRDTDMTKDEWSKDGNTVKIFYPDRFMNQDVTMVFSYNLKNQNWTLEKTNTLQTYKQSEKK